MGRKIFDSFFCKRWAGIESFGSINPWNILPTYLDKNSIIYSAGVGEIFLRKGWFLDSRSIELFDPHLPG
jgi:hypothetical protein